MYQWFVKKMTCWKMQECLRPLLRVMCRSQLASGEYSQFSTGCLYHFAVKNVVLNLTSALHSPSPADSRRRCPATLLFIAVHQSRRKHLVCCSRSEHHQTSSAVITRTEHIDLTSAVFFSKESSKRYLRQTFWKLLCNYYWQELSDKLLSCRN